MTVCSLLFCNQIPIVITDSLISDDKHENSYTDTPINFYENRTGLSMNKIQYPIGMANKIQYPIGMANKIWKIIYGDKTIYMLYAGSIDSAKKFLNNISTFNYDNVITLIESNSFEKNLKNHGYLPNDLSVILIYLDNNLDDKRRISYWFYNAAYPKDMNNYCISIGSGSELFLEKFVNLFKSSCKERNNRLYAFSELTEENIFDKDLEKDLEKNLKDLEKNLEGKILFSLDLLANLTKESLQKNSKLLSKSCGGLFNIFFLPDLYSVKNDCVFTSPICQIFLELKSNKLYLDKLIITSRHEYFESIVSINKLELSNFDSIEINKKNMKKYHIRDTYRLSNINNELEAINDMAINHLIIYIHDNQKQCHTVHSTLNKDGVMSVSSTDKNIKLTFLDRFIEKIFNRFNKA